MFAKWIFSLLCFNPLKRVRTHTSCHCPCAGVAIGIYIYLKDHHEREPIGLLLRAFLFGILSVIVTLLISSGIDLFVSIDPSSLIEQAVHAFIIVALVEEFSKFIFVRGILYNSKHFNEPFDGIVYSVMVSMGFATLENVLYAFQNGMGTALMRMFTAVPAHATFAVLMGFFSVKPSLNIRKVTMPSMHWVLLRCFMAHTIIVYLYRGCPASY